MMALNKKKKDVFGKGPNNLLKESNRRGYGASPTNFLLGSKKGRKSNPAPSEPTSP